MVSTHVMVGLLRITPSVLFVVKATTIRHRWVDEEPVTEIPNDSAYRILIELAASVVRLELL